MGSPSKAASNQPASDAPPSSDAGDTFPGDLLPAGETEAASPEALSDEPGLAVDVIAWADKLIDDLGHYGHFANKRTWLYTTRSAAICRP